MKKWLFLQFISLTFVYMAVGMFFFARTAQAHCGNHSSQPPHGLPDVPYVGCVNPSLSNGDRNITAQGQFANSCDTNGNCMAGVPDGNYIVVGGNYGHYYVFENGSLIDFDSRPSNNTTNFAVGPKTFNDLTVGASYIIDVAACILGIPCDIDSFSWTPPIPYSYSEPYYYSESYYYSEPYYYSESYYYSEPYYYSQPYYAPIFKEIPPF